MYENSAIPLVHISAYHGDSDGSSDGEGNEFWDDGPSGDAQNMSKYPMLSKLGADLYLSTGVNEISLSLYMSLSRYVFLEISRERMCCMSSMATRALMFGGEGRRPPLSGAFAGSGPW